MKALVWSGGMVAASVAAFLIGSSDWPFIAVLAASLGLITVVCAVCLTLLILLDRPRDAQRGGTPVEL
jgi:hypothetical protein